MPTPPNKPPSLMLRLRYRLQLRHRLMTPYRWGGLLLENWRYRRVRPEHDISFHIVSCMRNAKQDALKCLDSVQMQAYPRRRFRHTLIDDASTDQTAELVRQWFGRNPDHRVTFVHHEQHQGATRNTLAGFAMSNPGEVVVELNGDDWLPDAGVLDHLNRVYADPDVWMTYNTTIFPDGRVKQHSYPFPARIRRSRKWRYYRWRCCPLHTFRAELFSHLKETTMVDPETGEYWSNADDHAIYYAYLEMCGEHARHLFRPLYVQNVRDYSEVNKDPGGQYQRSRRIIAQTPYPSLEKLGCGKEQTLGVGADSLFPASSIITPTT